MKVLITGASSGIGKDMARILDKKGYSLILVARRKDKLENIKNELKNVQKIICLDLSLEESCFELYRKLENENIDILINNAGFGDCGEFYKTDLIKELAIIETNIKAVHILTKLFLQNFKKKNKGWILNVASFAGFVPGPYMACYYASKSYVLSISEAINEELRQANSKVYVGAFCPGPIKTEFEEKANVKFTMNLMNSMEAANIAIKGLEKEKLVIIPMRMKVFDILLRITPRRLVLLIMSKMQRRV